jgi:hypothetical protein
MFKSFFFKFLIFLETQLRMGLDDFSPSVMVADFIYFCGLTGS